MKMKAKVDRDACISCGLCESVCPDVFKLDDESISTVIQDPVAAEKILVPQTQYMWKNNS